MNYQYPKVVIPASKKASCKISHIVDNTGTNADLDSDIHDGFTIGKGKTMYWMMIWHQSGHVTVFNRDGEGKRRWISGDTEITIHFK